MHFISVGLFSILFLLFHPSGVFASGGCTNQSAEALAYQAIQEYSTELANIQQSSAIPLIEVGICSEVESYGIETGNWTHGVFIWFNSAADRKVFHETTGFWHGGLVLSNGCRVPICSRVASQGRDGNN